MLMVPLVIFLSVITCHAGTSAARKARLATLDMAALRAEVEAYAAGCGGTCRRTCLDAEKRRFDECPDECESSCADTADPNHQDSCNRRCWKKCYAVARDEAHECEQGCSMACTMDRQESRCESICLIPCQEKDPHPTCKYVPKAEDNDSDEDPGLAVADDPNAACPPDGDPDSLETCVEGCVNPCMADAAWRNPPKGTKLTADQKRELHTLSPWQRWLRLVNDGRQRTEATGYTGIAIDSFAAGEFNDYVNPDASGDVKVRGIAGADFAFRLVGNQSAGRQLWFFGKAVYGVRSTEIDCKVDPNTMLATNPLCDQNTSSSTRTADIVRNATSLEAYAGLRWEFLPLQDRWSASAASLYAKAQFGFLTVAGQGKDVVDVRSYAIGSITTNGRYQGSYAEIGYGRTDLFLHHANRRFKLNGFLTWRALALPWRRPLAQPFVQITFDGDLGRGSDSVQTYIGVSFDLDQFDPKQTFKLGGS